MAWLLSTGFRVLLWFLLTADGSAANLLIGLGLAVVLPRARAARWSLRRMAVVVGQSLVAIPRAYGEAFALMVSPGDREGFTELPSGGIASPLAVFLEVFAITLTPFTIVLGVQSDGQALRYRVHQLRPGRDGRAVQELTHR